jgi:tetratricopeptide (TPR) repeat protein
MRKDLHGLTLSTDSGTAVDAFDRATLAYLKYRTDAARHLGAALKADPQFALGHVLRGYFNMLAYNKANIQGAAEALVEARKYAKRTTTREAAHIEALARWVDGDLDRMLDVWRGIFAEYPHDVLAFRLHHFNAFWLGRPATMQAEVERVFPHWSGELPGWGMILSCRCFAHEEAGNYTLAEGAGRQAIEIDPGDLWGAHAIAHVLEMQGRRSEGIDWLKRLEPNWEGANNLKHHLFWHRALFHIERREFGEVLSPTTTASATSARRSPRRCPTCTSTFRTPPPCCFGSSARASMSATAGSSLPTRPRRASAIACQPSPCRTG